MRRCWSGDGTPPSSRAIITLRHCERSEAIQSLARNALDCRVALRLAMTSVSGGVRGGEIVAEGTPEEVAQVERSFTGAYLKPMLAKAGGARKAAG